MKKLTLSVALAVATVVNAFACTNLIVGKNASADGSTIVSYSADSYGLFGELYHYPAGMHKKGTWIDVHEWDTGKYLGRIEQARQTYNTPCSSTDARSTDAIEALSDSSIGRITIGSLLSTVRPVSTLFIIL